MIVVSQNNARYGLWLCGDDDMPAQWATVRGCRIVDTLDEIGRFVDHHNKKRRFEARPYPDDEEEATITVAEWRRWSERH